MSYSGSQQGPVLPSLRSGSIPSVEEESDPPFSDGYVRAPAFECYHKICLFYSLGSPDPDGRQIDGMGGGISSLSKVVVLSVPGEAVAETSRSPDHSFPDGVSWGDDVKRASREKDGWDVVYRFAQVGVRDGVVDWGSTCGNLVAAVAHVMPPLIVAITSVADFRGVVVCRG